MSSSEMRTTGVLARWAFRRAPHQLQAGDARVVVEQQQVEVLRALDVGDGVPVAVARADVPAGELQHVADGLKQHPVLLVVEDGGGAGGHR
jgi:hypothetical protein